MFSFWKRARPNDKSAERVRPGQPASAGITPHPSIEPIAEQLPVDRSSGHRDLLAGLLGSGAWCVDYLKEEDDGTIEVAGWTIAPGYEPGALDFTLNDQPFDEVAYPLPREDLREAMWYVPEGLASGFVCRMHRRLEEVCPNGSGVLKFIDKQTGQPLREEHNYYYDARKVGPELPPPSLRARVHGSANGRSFRLEGYTHFVKLELVLRRLFGRGYRDFGSLLDWGCGCGRFLRYFRDIDADLAITGADVDREAVEWVATNFPFVRGVSLPLHPPSPLQPSAHDLIIGISIFTHLGEPEQFEWLEELQRVAAPGAVLLMSVHGETAVSRQPWSVRQLFDWRARGFAAGTSGDLDGVLEEADYYKTTFHTREYILANWSRYFDIKEIVPGYLGNLQDLVVMVRR